MSIIDLGIDAASALPGHENAIEISGVHALLGSPIKGSFPDKEIAYFALGCFWGAERLFWQLEGVYSTAVGYMNGFTKNPRYEEVCSGRTGHAEAVMVVFSPQETTYSTLLQEFWQAHDPTQGMRQGNDRGTQYRSGIYWTSAEQEKIALASVQSFGKSLRQSGLGPITTEIARASEFFYAEEYHQQYLHKNPNGYCGLKGTGVSCPISW